MRAAHRCYMADCTSAATERCFDCGTWCCDEHRSAIQIPTYTIPFHEALCAACLQLHLATDDRYGPIALELPAARLDDVVVDGGTAAAESAELGL